MPKTNGALALASYDDIFQADAMPTPTGREQVREIPMNELHPFENYPFKVWEDAAMMENVESIKDGATVRPCVARSRKAGGYEIIAASGMYGLASWLE